MFESKNKYFGRKKGKSFVRLEQYSKFLKEPNKRLFNKIKTPRILEIGIGDGEKISEDAKLYSKINFIGSDIFADGVLRAIRNSVDDNLKNEINISNSAKEYVERIREVAKNSPELLVGHHYTRYIGDLSGGQILKRIAKKALNLQGNDGLNFYEFELIADEKKFKEEYSLTLNQLPINQKTANQIIDEANQAFTYNMKMFKELEGNLIAVLGKIVFNYITKKVRKGSTET